MWFDGVRQPNTLYVLNSSRGKDSTACLRAIKILGWPLDAVICADMWATKDIPAARPEMVAYQDEWDATCEALFGVPVLKPYAKKPNGEKLTYEDLFYRPMKPKQERERERELRGWAMRGNQYCTGELKIAALRISNAERKLVHIRAQNRCLTGSQYQARMEETGVKRSRLPLNKRQDEAQTENIVHYIGIAADEPKRIKKHIYKKNIVLPLVQIGWEEDLCGLEATYMCMLSPTYDGGCRDGCWFCHNQTVDQLRRLRKDHPDLWALLMKWDLDSPVTFRPPGKNGKPGLTVHDFDRRFQCEDDGLIKADEKFRWADIEQPQLRWF